MLTAVIGFREQGRAVKPRDKGAGGPQIQRRETEERMCEVMGLKGAPQIQVVGSATLGSSSELSSS